MIAGAARPRVLMQLHGSVMWGPKAVNAFRGGVFVLRLLETGDNLTRRPYAPRISRRDSTRSIKGRMPSSLEMAKDSSSKVIALARSPLASRSRRASA